MLPDKLFEVLQPVRVMFGQGQLSKLGDVATPLGTRVCLVTMKELVDLGLVQPAIDLLKKSGLDVEVFDGVKPEPTCADVDAAADFIRQSSADLIVAFGGGSVLDFAKALAIRATHPELIWSYVNLSNRPPLPIQPTVLPIIAIPTTSGTGAEVTPYAVLSNPETIQKGTIKSPTLFPKVAIVDPELTQGLPKTMTAATGIDAFAHALESYLNQANRTPFSDLVASEAMRTIVQSLPEVLVRPDDIHLRTNMAWGSLLAGLAITNAGTTVAHALAQPLGARSHLPHSVTVSIFTVPVLRHTWEAALDRFDNLCTVLNPGVGQQLMSRHRAEKTVALVDELLTVTDMNHRLGNFSISPEQTQGIVDDVFSYMSRPLAQHPKQFSREEIQTIIQEAA